MTQNKKFVAKHGFDSNANSIDNLGVAGASLTLAGAYALALTQTGPTNVTLPTSGTLATTLSTVAAAAALATGRTISTTGDATGTSVAFNGTANLSFPLTLATVNANVGTWGAVTVNAKGLVTAGSNPTITGDATGTAVGATTALTLANTGVGAGTYRSVTVDAKGRVTAGTNPTTLAGHGITDGINISAIGAANGVASLDAGGKLPASQLPAIAISDTYVVANQAAMLALSAEVGDVAVRTDVNQSFILKTAGATVLANWQVLLTPTDAGGTVTSVATVAPAAGLTISGGPITTSGSFTFALANDLAALEALSTTGFAKRTGADTWTLDNSTYITGNQSISFSGDATGTGTTAVALTLAASGVSAGTYKSVTVDAKGRVTGGTNPTTLAGHGITDAVSSVNGSSGAVTLTTANIGENTNLYYTDARARASTSVSGTGLSYNSGTGVITSNATTANTASTVVARDASGNFTAGQVTLTSARLGAGAVLQETSVLTTSTTAANQVVETLPSATYRTVKFLVQVVSGTAYQTTEILAVHSGTTVYMTEFGTVQTGATLASFDMDILSGNIRLLVTPVNAVTTIKSFASAVAV